MKYIIEKIKYSNLYIIEQTDKKWFITLVNNKKSELFIIDNFHLNLNEDSDKLLLEKINPKTPILLCVYNKEVLIKKRNLSSDSSINDSFPNINLDDFYYESVKLDTDLYYDAIIRKEKIKEYLSHFEELNLFIIDYRLGNHSAYGLLKNSNLKNLWIHNLPILQGDNFPKQQTFDNIVLTPENTNGFATAFQYYTNYNQITCNEKNIKERIKYKYLNYFLFKKIFTFRLLLF